MRKCRQTEDYDLRYTLMDNIPLSHFCQTLLPTLSFTLAFTDRQMHTHTYILRATEETVTPALWKMNYEEKYGCTENKHACKV